MLNSVALIGFVSRPPRRLGGEFFFPLAVYRDPDRPRRGEEREIPDFPPVIVVSEYLPDFVKHRAVVRVEGWLRTRNRTEPLRKDIKRLLLRAGVEKELVEKIIELVPEGYYAKHVEVEVIAERIFKE
jgi:hypothetical protein